MLSRQKDIGKNSLRKRVKLAGLFLLLAFCVFSMAACKKTGQPSDTFIDAYIELRVASELYGSTPNAGLMRRDVLKKYGYTVESFNEEADRLRADFNLWETYEKRVLERLDTLAQIQSRNAPSVSSKANTALTVERQQAEEKRRAEAAQNAAKRRAEFEGKHPKKTGKPAE